MTVSNRPRKIESKANRMIDDLFLEIDQVLEPNYQFQTLTWRKQEYFSSQGTYIAQTQVAAHWGTSSPTPIREGFSHSLSRSMSDSMVSYPESKREQFVQKTPEKKTVPLWLRHLDKVVFLSSCSFLVWTLFLLEENKFSVAAINEDQEKVSSLEIDRNQVNSNSEFIQYMARALGEIKQEKAIAKPEKKPDPIQPIQPKTESVAVTSGTKKVEKSQISSLPALPPPPPTQQPTPTPSSPPKETTQQPTPTPSSPPKETTQETTPNPSSPPKESQPSPSEKPPALPEHTLIGLLELGEHSAALLKVEGRTQRVMLGENIPGSNWELVTVANQQAIFANKNQQKTMYVGGKLSVQ